MASKSVKKKDMKFKNKKSLEKVQNVLMEADNALNDRSRTIGTSSIPNLLTTISAAGASATTLGIVSLWAAGADIAALGIIGGGAAMGAGAGVVGGGAVVGAGFVTGPAAGIAAVAAPAAIPLAPIIAVGAGAAAIGAGIGGAVVHAKNKKVENQKMMMYQEAIRKQNAIIRALKAERNADKERMDYLNSLANALIEIINDLGFDLGLC